MDCLITILGVSVAMNFSRPEKKLEKKVEHLYASTDPQFFREMSVLLGPGILQGNVITALNNSREIFPSMFSAIRAAKVSAKPRRHNLWRRGFSHQWLRVVDLVGRNSEALF
jgi:cardiolipin synthase A/B